MSPWGISQNGVCQTTKFCPANCQLCVNEQLCLTCAALYTVNSTGLCVQCNVLNCATCQQANVCANCAPSYTLASTNICISCNIDKCTSCLSNAICSACNDTASSVEYFPSSNGNLCVQCDLSLVNMTNCQSCSADNSCAVCAPGYQVYSPTTNGNNVCIPCAFANCLTCNFAGCQTCAPGYNPVNGTCLQCQYPCATCVSGSSTSCQACTTPFYIITPTANGTCLPNSVPNCISYNTSNTSLCTGCSTTYTLNTTTNTCQLSCPVNCLTCLSNGTCTSCMSSYILTASGTCNQCQMTGCQTCTNIGSVCTSCYPGFYLLNSECKLCPGYCSQCNSYLVCTALVQNNQQVLYFNQTTGETELAICQQNCQTCSSFNAQLCLQCMNGTYLSKGNCLKCSSSCLTCNPSSPNICLSCYPNSFLYNNNTCLSCSSNCFTCQDANNLGKCLSCA